jgi:uncharacterized protein (DUF1499 family)
MNGPPRLRARTPLPPLRQWLLRVALLATIGLAPYVVTYDQPEPELGTSSTGGLKPCSQSPNCVSSDWSYMLASMGAQYRKKDLPPQLPHFVDPIELADESPAAWKELAEVVRKQPGVTIVETTDHYLRAVRSTTIYGFLDDFELLRLDRTVLVRSAARVAYSDFGRNRRFVERIRSAFTGRPREQWF